MRCQLVLRRLDLAYRGQGVARLLDPSQIAIASTRAALAATPAIATATASPSQSAPYAERSQRRGGPRHDTTRRARESVTRHRERIDESRH
jgi:hypothetical protein